MSDVVIQVDSLWKKYRLGVLGTGTLRHDFNRWQDRFMGTTDPHAKEGSEGGKPKAEENYGQESEAQSPPPQTSTSTPPKNNIIRQVNMRVLVTGGAGFIGSHLCDALIQRGDKVWCADNLYLGREENIKHLLGCDRFNFCKLDVLETPALERLFAQGAFDMVFHLAANSDISQGNQDHRLDHRLNYLTTVEVLEAMLHHGVKQIFFASTSAIFGDTRHTLREDTGPLRPVSFYGASKLAAEAYISVMVHSYNIQGRVLRFPNVVGERCTHGAVHDFIGRLQKDPTRLQVLGDGHQNKPYLYVRDLVKAILAVCEKATEPLAVYHVAGEGLTTVREIAEMVVEEMGLGDIPIEYSGGRTGWVGDVPYFSYDTGKIRALGFRPAYNSTDSVRVAIRRILGKEKLSACS